MRIDIAGLMVVALAAGASSVLTARAADWEVGTLARAPAEYPLPGVARSGGKTAGFAARSANITAVDVYNRQSVVDYFNNTYANPTPDPQWTGAINGCVAGQVSAGYRQAIKARINYYRAMAGVLPINELRAQTTYIGNDPDGLANPAQAALIMSAQGALSHAPSDTWACYSQPGYFGAQVSNLSLGSAGPAAIDSYIVDAGANNTAVGHRRWILNPPIMEMDSGDIPGGDGIRAANALRVIGVARDFSRMSREDYVAWPNPGHVPSSLVPPRWSYSQDGADFSQASVRLYRNGVTSPATLEPLRNGFGQNTLVWVGPEGPDPAADTLYSVALANVLIGGVSQSVHYETLAVNAQPGASSMPDADADGIPSGEIVDLDLPPEDFWWLIEANRLVGQDFTNSTTGRLTGINLALRCDDADTTVAVEVRDSTGVLATFTRQAASFTPGVWQRFETNLDVLADRQYRVTFNPNKTCGWYASGNQRAMQTTVLPSVLDNCPTVPNPDQSDGDANGSGDACDPVFTLPPNSWRMISLPSVPPTGMDKVADIIGDDIPGGATYSVYSYNATAGSYAEQTANSVMVPGQGYWVIQYSGVPAQLDMPAGSSPLPYQPTMRCSNAMNCSPHVLVANAGQTWNLFGPTSLKQVSHDALRASASAGVCSDLDACTLAEADEGAGNLLSPTFYEYSAPAYSSVTAGGSLNPWSGYWVQLFAQANNLQPTLWVPH